LTWGRELGSVKVILSLEKKIENINNLLIDVKNYPSFHPFVA
jgi:hypothetical protein